MALRRSTVLWLLVPLVLFPYLVGLLGGSGAVETGIWLGLIVVWLIALAFSTRTGAPLPPHVRNIMIGIVAAAAIGFTLAALLSPGSTGSVVGHYTQGSANR
ncbi:MAG TPA: hypothetical protein VFT75_06205 [Nocardioidaceae bacterium]|jgi:hypothetical protein|nr:hypothetical protein [Nocardioidaceae bacterium]